MIEPQRPHPLLGVPAEAVMERISKMIEGSAFTGLVLPLLKEFRPSGDFLAPKMDFFFIVTEGLLNPNRTLHGGAIATIVDELTSMHLTAHILEGSVSVDLHVAYHSGAAAGDSIRLESHVLRTGKRVCFTEAKLYRVKDGALIATALHTKAVVPASKGVLLMSPKL